jgi:type IX secretion system PorP/SprF family membrane protein
MRKTIFISIVLVCAAHVVLAQYFQYSQYNFATQRINPAIVAASNYASLGMIYRNQSTGGSFNLNSNLLSASYPILSKKTGQRWSGVGVTLMDDRAGGIFATQEVSMSYAVNIPLSKYQTLSLGFKGLFQQRRINLDGLYTGSQYIPDRGFDQSIFNGENLQFLNNNFFTISTGLYWQQTDKNGFRNAYWGISIFDFNKPNASFSKADDPYSSTAVFSGGVKMYQHDKVLVMPEILFTHSAGNNVINAGAVTSYSLAETKGKSLSRIDILTKYVLGRSGILGLQLHRENFSIGCSYDFPILKSNVGNLGAFEVGIELRRLVESKYKRKTNANVKRTPPKSPVVSQKPKTTLKPTSSVVKDSVQRKPPVKNLQTTLKQKQDSVIATAHAGNVKHQPLVLEKITLHFNFEFNSSDLDDDSKTYLDDLIEALKENDHLRIKLTGHTDNVGSAKFNQKLSLYRADSIKEYLKEKGIDPGRIDTEGRGLHEPLNENKTDEDRAKNRRVELVILYDN